MASKLTRKRKKYHPTYEELKEQQIMDDKKTTISNSNETNTQGVIVQRAIASAKKHNIELKCGRANNAAGNCIHEFVIFNINDRSCFREKLPMSPDVYCLQKNLDR